MRSVVKPCSRAALLLIVVALLVVPSSVRAAVITGQLSTTGGVRLSSTAMDFLPPVGGGTGTFNVTPPVSGTFAGTVGTTGTIKDITTGSLPVSGWMTLAAMPGVQFDLLSFAPGVYPSGAIPTPAAAGQIYTPPGSIFNFSNLSPTSSTVSFTANVNAHDAVGPATPYTGVFTAQFSDQNFQSVVATLNAGGTVDASYSASFTPTAPIPEPSMGVLSFGCAAAVVGLRGRSRR
jgi:hypothetical protein